MIAIIIIGIILLLLLLIAMTRVGIVFFCDGTLSVKLRIGPFQMSPHEKSKLAAEKAENKAGAPETTRKKQKSFPKLTADELIELAATALSALERSLHRVCRRFRIDPLVCELTIGGKDPADIASLYGYANAALWTLMPRAEELFNIPNPRIHLGMDYESEKSVLRGRAGISLRVGELAMILLSLVYPMHRWYRKLKKRLRNSIPTEKENQENEQSQMTA